MICDEPTAALDPRAEHAVYRTLHGLARMPECTTCGARSDRHRGPAVLLISHRLASVRMADWIYVLDRGRVAESGTHADLMRAGGLYHDLYSMQAAGYRSEPATTRLAAVGVPLGEGAAGPRRPVEMAFPPVASVPEPVHAACSS
jgi:ATP-binding cassette subfamily B protein